MFRPQIALSGKFFDFRLKAACLFAAALLIGISTVVLAGPGSKGRQQYTVFDPPNATYTSASNINDLGAVTGYFYDADGRIHGFVRHANGQFIVIEAIPGARDTEAVGTNVRGETAGISEAQRSFIRDRKGNITFFSAPDAVWTYASAINNRGAVAGTFSSRANGISHGFVRDPGGNIAVIEPANGHDAHVSGMNDRGDVVGNFFDASQGDNQRIYLRDREGDIAVLDIPNGIPYVTGINNHGAIAGIYVDQDHRIAGFFRYPNGTVVSLGIPSPQVTGINDRDEVVGIFGDPARGGKTLRFHLEPDGRITVLTFPVRQRPMRVASTIAARFPAASMLPD